MKRVSAFAKHLSSATNENENEDLIQRPALLAGCITPQVAWASLGGMIDQVPKVNQDMFRFRNNTACLCDGHGEFGEVVSDLVTQSITALDAPDAPEDEGKIAYKCQELIVQKLGNASLYAGSTGVWIRKLEGDCLRISNVGDSRCLVVDSEWRIRFETRDHKPDDLDETARIEKYGGKVTKPPGGVARVAGLALSRAFGDFAARTSGVNAVPDVTVIPLSFTSYPSSNSRIAFVFVASDGVFDVLTSQQVVDFLRECKAADEAVDSALKKLVRKCSELWDIDCEGEYCDDITCAIWLMT